MASDLEIIEPKAPAPVVRSELTVTELKQRLAVITDAMHTVMKKGIDYGVVPGVEKPSLLKPGAEKLCVLFQFGGRPRQIDRVYDENHLTINVEYELFHIPTGRTIGVGVGSCSTKETKYAYRKGARLCPKCGKESIIKGKDEYGGGWLCWKKKDGCGAKFKDGDELIESQSTERVENLDVADQYNTVLKMAKKRAKIDATLDATGASAIFTQDVEDFADAPAAPTDDDVTPKTVAEYVERDTAADNHNDPDPGDTFEDAPPPILLNEFQVKELDDLFTHIESFPADGAKEFRDKALKRWSLKSLRDMAQSDFQRRKEILEAQVKIYEGFSRVHGKK